MRLFDGGLSDEAALLEGAARGGAASQEPLLRGQPDQGGPPRAHRKKG